MWGTKRTNTAKQTKKKKIQQWKESVVVSLELIRKTGGHPAAIIIPKFIFDDFILHDFIYCCQERAVLRGLQAQRGWTVAVQIQGQIFVPQAFNIITYLTVTFWWRPLNENCFLWPSFFSLLAFILCFAPVGSHVMTSDKPSLRKIGKCLKKELLFPTMPGGSGQSVSLNFFPPFKKTLKQPCSHLETG